MKKYILFFLIAGLTLLVSREVFSQQTGDNSSKLFNEGGYVRGITPARAIGLIELALGLSSLIVAIRAKKRSSKKGAKIALVLGFGAIVFSSVHLFLTAGAVFGSGSGKAGAIIAFILGLIGIIIALLTVRSLKTNEQQ
ncbi:MAG: hypothetical protein HC831_05340 [Chloroflexia bacterium]|nr:hypothetical protein [Bacteroidales bacterium]NJO88444.1 hypothetical protein [Chloroflexia bacterium]